MKKKITEHDIDRMFADSNKLNTRSLVLWKKALKLREKAGRLLTDLDLGEKRRGGKHVV